MPPPAPPVPGDCAARIRRLRERRGWLQQELADLLDVTNVTVSRWETGQSRPQKAAWRALERLEAEASEPEPAAPAAEADPGLDFAGGPAAVLAVAEAERLSYGHLANPFFATETSRIDPLPHQHLAVYEHMLKQPRLRFLLADDAGAGKTIMTGLYVREMLSRRRIRRVLVAPPAGLVGNWQAEMSSLFGLGFALFEGPDLRGPDNPFKRPAADLAIVSVDTLRQPRALERLGEEGVEPYDLVVFDEAHKLGFQRDESFKERRTDRYRLAEALAGVPGVEPPWRLPWSAQHLLLLTATPHMGKSFPYFALWRLLLPTTLTTEDALAAFPPDRRADHFLRRTKEEMVHLDGRPLYPQRVCQTLSYALGQGDNSEQALYDETTAYLQDFYNRAELLNASAARMVVSVFQRRLASSTFALSRSLERRLEKLDELTSRVQRGGQTPEEFRAWFLEWRRKQVKEAQRSGDPYTSTSADEVEEEDLEQAEGALASVFAADTAADLRDERHAVAGLVELAKRVMAKGEETKFRRLREILFDPEHAHEKVLVFTEHRDTLDFLLGRLQQLGYTGQVAQIHGGMHHRLRQEQLGRFRREDEAGGARLMVATDAAGEGLNMQFAGRMVNYDLPWNPARLEQRMGRIHRYGQKRDRVFIFNLVAAGERDAPGGELKRGTREGKVLAVLLEKLETIRAALDSDKVFDSIGRVMSGVGLKDYLDRVSAPGADADAIAAELGGEVTAKQVEALAEAERKLFGEGGDVARQLPRLRASAAREAERRLMPGFVRRFVEDASPPLGLRVAGDTGNGFAFEATERGALDWLLPLLEEHGGDPDAAPPLLCCERPGLEPGPGGGPPRLWLHPGEAVFERLRGRVGEALGPAARRGGVLVDPEAGRPHLLHLGVTRVVRSAGGPGWPELAQLEVLESRLIAARQHADGGLEPVSPQRLLCLRGRRAGDGGGVPHEAQRLMGSAPTLLEQAAAFVAEGTRQRAAEVAQEARGRAADAAGWVAKGFAAERVELNQARTQLRPKVQKGDRGALTAMRVIQERQRSLAERRARALGRLEAEAALVAAEPRVSWIAHALVLPGRDPGDTERLLHSSEAIAQTHAVAWLEAEGAAVTEVHTPRLARAAGLADFPGYDLLADFPGGDRWHVEVKGRMSRGDVEMTPNEWGRACNLGAAYWLFAVFGCASSAPQLYRVRNPFEVLLRKAAGTVLLDETSILRQAEPS